VALKRVVGLKEALAINLAAIIGAGIYVISGIAAGIAGPSAIIAVLIGALASIFTGLSFAELAHLYANEGGNYEYSREVLGNYAGFLAGTVWLFASAVSGSAIALSFASYFDSLFGLHTSLIEISAFFITILALINYFGVKKSAQTALIFTVVNIAVLIFFVIVGVFFIKPENYVPVFPKGLGSMFAASAFVFFAYTGFARVTMLGEEIKKPKSTIPKAIIYSIIISAGIYALIMLVLIGIVPYKLVSTSASPLAFALDFATKNPNLGYVVSVGALIATFDVDLAMILGISRVLFAMSRDVSLPKHLSILNKYGVPSVAVAVSALAMMALLAVNFKEIVSLSNAGSLFSYTLANIAAIKLGILRRKEPEKMVFAKHHFYIIPIVGALTTISLLLFLTVSSILSLVAFVLLVSIYYFASGKHLRAKPKHERNIRW